jgi:hypothetical protein
MRGARHGLYKSPRTGVLSGQREEDPLPIFLCNCCRRQVVLCSSCDRGQRYCGSDCALDARWRNQREARARYQATPRGRALHAERNRQYRIRRRVTDQGPIPQGKPVENAADHTSLDRQAQAIEWPAAASSPRLEFFAAAAENRLLASFACPGFVGARRQNHPFGERAETGLSPPNLRGFRPPLTAIFGARPPHKLGEPRLERFRKV